MKGNIIKMHSPTNLLFHCLTVLSNQFYFMAVKFLLPTQKLLITWPELTTSLTPQLLLNILHKITMKSSTLNSSSGPYLCIPKPPMLAVGGRLVVTRNRPVRDFGCRTGNSRKWISFPVGRILPDRKQVFSAKHF